MLNLLNDYIATLNTEIESYEALIASKRAELEHIAQIQGQVVEALGTLKDVVNHLKDRDPNALAAIKETAYRIFEGESLIEDTPKTNTTSALETVSPSNTEDTPIEKSLNLARLSESVLYNPDTQVAYVGINAQDRARSWGNWLCYTHTVGTRFQVENKSHSENYRYDLKIEGISEEDTKILAQCDTSKHPGSSANEFWQPNKRHPIPQPPRPKTCDIGELAVGDIARKEDGRQYRVIGVSEDGSVVKVVNNDGMEMAFSVGVLYLVKKADSPEEQSEASLPDTQADIQPAKSDLKIEQHSEAPLPDTQADIQPAKSSLKIEQHSEASLSDTQATGSPEAEDDEPEYNPEVVRIVTDRFNGAFNGLVGKVTKRSNLGVHVLLPSNEEKFFLDREIEESLDEVPF